MREGSFRDWQVYSCVKDFHKDSYDFVGRDMKLENGVSAPFLRYRGQNNLVDVVFFSSDSYEDVMEEVNSVRDLLEDEAFEYRLSVTVTSNAIPGENVRMGGDCYIDSSSDFNEVAANLDSIFASDFSDLDLLYRKV